VEPEFSVVVAGVTVTVDMSGVADTFTGAVPAVDPVDGA
jgi:hypothetical protein